MDTKKLQARDFITLGIFTALLWVVQMVIMYMGFLSPFVGAGLSFLILGERLTPLYFAAFVVMVLGTVLVVRDSLIRHHLHEHQHQITHTHNGTTHTHVVSHSHEHNHLLSDELHEHHHSKEELLMTLKEIHQI